MALKDLKNLFKGTSPVEKPSEPIVLEGDDDGTECVVLMPDGLKYRLQHPGYGMARKWQDAAIDVHKGGIDQTKTLKVFLEACVTPEGHNHRPTLDNLTPRTGPHWELVCTRFLRGTLYGQDSQ